MMGVDLTFNMQVKIMAKNPAEQEKFRDIFRRNFANGHKNMTGVISDLEAKNMPAYRGLLHFISASSCGMRK